MSAKKKTIYLDTYTEELLESLSKDFRISSSSELFRELLKLGDEVRTTVQKGHLGIVGEQSESDVKVKIGTALVNRLKSGNKAGD